GRLAPAGPPMAAGSWRWPRAPSVLGWPAEPEKDAVKKDRVESAGLRARRTQTGLTQEALARAAGITRQALSDVEAGRYAPSTEISLRLARTLGCRVEDLFWLDGPRAPLDVEVVAETGAAD